MLAILATHPIQYQVPLWRALARDGSVPFEVWYLSRHGTTVSRDAGFGESFEWDIDLISGYPHRFLSPSADDVASFIGVRLPREARTLLRGSNVTAVLVNGWNVAAYWQAIRTARKLGMPVWMRGESNDLGTRPFLRGEARRAMHRWLFRACDEFLYIGSANKRLYESHGVPDTRLHFTPYAVDNERFERQADELRPTREAIRAAWSIPQGAFCVLFAGKLIPKKHPLDLIAAVSIAETGNHPLHLLFAGSGPLGPVLRSACATVFDAELNGPTDPGLTTAPRASFAGFLNQTQIARAYVAADCLVLPSDSGETWGLVVNEAMATGLQCVASDACGCAEDLVRPVSPRMCFSARDVKGLVAALTEARVAPPPRERWIARVGEFSVNRCVRAISSLWADPGRRHAPGAIGRIAT